MFNRLDYNIDEESRHRLTEIVPILRIKHVSIHISHNASVLILTRPLGTHNVQNRIKNRLHLTEWIERYILSSDNTIHPRTIHLRKNKIPNLTFTPWANCPWASSPVTILSSIISVLKKMVSRFFFSQLILLTTFINHRKITFFYG